MKSLLFSQSVLGLTPSTAAEESGVVLNPVTSFGGCGKEFFQRNIHLLVCCLDSSKDIVMVVYCSGSNLSDIPGFMGRRCATRCEEESAAAPRMFKFCILLASLCPVVCLESKF